jgi:hypothetical protein
MAIDTGKIIRLLFWAKFVPLQRRQKKNDNDKDDNAWEWDLWSPRFLLLLLVMISTTTAYLYFIFATIEPLEETTVISVITVLYRLLNLSTVVFNPVLAGQVHCYNDWHVH